jgi:hypothetical protein
MSRQVSISVVLLLASIAGILASWRHVQTVTPLAPADIKFGEINNLDYDPATGVFQVTGSDPFGYLELPSHSIPLLELRLEFAGAYRPGGWYVYPSPAHLRTPIINQDWVVTATPEAMGNDHALVWTLESSQLARIDFPDEITEPMRLKRATLTTGYQNSRSPIYLGAVVSAVAATLLLLIHLLAPRIDRPVAQAVIMFALIGAKLAVARDLGQTFMTQLLHDDRLFMDQGRSILNGEWLGPFHELTLAKGPTFSIFLAASAASGWPLQFNVLLFHAIACLAFVAAVSPWVVKPGWRLLLFTALLFDPHSMSAELISRVLRSAIHPALTLFVFAGLLGLLTRADRAWFKLLPWAILAGLAGAGFWYSREEGVWALPSVLLLTASGGFLAWRNREKTRAAWIVILIVPMITFWAGKSAVRGMNYQHYGVWMGVDVMEGTYPDAYGAILRVTNPDPIKGVPATQATRELIYAQSPAFAQLRDAMENQMQPKWAFAGWHRHPHARAETEIRGGWFPWALREAAALAGFYESAEQAEQLWTQVAAQINQAVDEGRLPGGRYRSGLAPVLDRRDILPTIKNWFRAVDLVIRADDFKAQGIPSRGSEADIRSMAEVFHATPVWEIGPTTTGTRLRLLIHQVYHWVGWPMTVLALIATLVIALRARHVESARIALATLLTFWGGITALALVVALVEATSFIAIIGAYLGPAAPLLIATWVLAPYFAWIHFPKSTAS